jgi:hypothetical protein
MPPDYLRILDGWSCPTCGHGLATRCDHCGESESHLARRTQGSAAKRLRALYRVPDVAELDAALIQQGKLPRPAHRPRKDPCAARVRYSYRLHPDTISKINDEAKRSGESAGQVIDRLAATLPA